MWHYNSGKAFLDRLPHDEDLLVSIKEAFQKNSTKMGFFVAIGAVKYARMAFYNQEDHTYHEFSVDEPAEILHCTGNVSELDGETFVHAHITLGLKDGTTKGGHLVEGTKIFACELFAIPLDGEQLKRSFDDVTGLKLWQAGKLDG
jgi:predicted DNA-binding protein with PD1-like motif